MRTILIVSLSVMSGCSEKDTTPPNDTSLLDTNPAVPQDTSEVGQQDTAPPEKLQGRAIHQILALSASSQAPNLGACRRADIVHSSAT